MSGDRSGSIPMVILGGSDRRPGSLPAGRPDLHALGTYKGVAIRVGGRPLIEHLVERVRAVRGFGPIGIAGPARVYAGLGMDVELIDTDGTIADNLRATFAHHRAVSAHRDDPGPLALLACDVLPAPEELGVLRELYAREAPCALWLPFVREPEDPEALGAFAWKPRYAIAPGPGAAPVRILPGHLAIVQPTALRLPLFFRLLDAAYRSRNRGVRARRAALLRAVLGSLVLRDLLGLARLRAPSLTGRVVGAGFRLARRLRAGELDNGELERLVERILVRRCAPPDRRRIRLPHTDVISLAEDIDTEEEAHQIGGDLAIPRAKTDGPHRPRPG